jgi:hypothetical protein
MRCFYDIAISFFGINERKRNGKATESTFLLLATPEKHLLKEEMTGEPSPLFGRIRVPSDR